MSIRNERIKLLANALKTAGTSCFAIGVLAPIAAAFYAVESASNLPTVAIVAGIVIWLTAAVALHLGARMTLRGLSE